MRTNDSIHELQCIKKTKQNKKQKQLKRQVSAANEWVFDASQLFSTAYYLFIKMQLSVKTDFYIYEDPLILLCAYILFKHVHS